MYTYMYKDVRTYLYTYFRNALQLPPDPSDSGAGRHVPRPKQCLRQVLTNIF